jgi:hypothetical protein
MSGTGLRTELGIYSAGGSPPVSASRHNVFVGLTSPHSDAQECDTTRRKDVSEQIKIVISGVEFPTNDNLSHELRTQLRENIEEREISIDPRQPDSYWLDELNEVTARDTLMNAGYSKKA